MPTTNPSAPWADIATWKTRCKCLSLRNAIQWKIKLFVSPLKVGQTVQVIGMAEEGECMSEIFFLITHKNSELAVPLNQLECQSPDEATYEAVAD